MMTKILQNPNNCKTLSEKEYKQRMKNKILFEEYNLKNQWISFIDIFCSGSTK